MAASGDVGVVGPDGRILAGTWVEAINLGAVLALTGLAAGKLIGADEATLDRVCDEAGSMAERVLRAALADPDMLRVAKVVEGGGS